MDGAAENTSSIISFNSIVVTANPRSESSEDSNSSSSSDSVSCSTGDRNRISHVDSEGFTHIRQHINNAISSDESTTTKSSSTRRTAPNNRFAALEHAPNLDHAYASMMRGIMQEMDPAIRQRIEERALIMSAMSTNGNSTTTAPVSSSRTLTERSRRNRQSSRARSQVETIVSEWRMNVVPAPIPGNNIAAHSNSPSNSYPNNDIIGNIVATLRPVSLPQNRHSRVDANAIPTGSDILGSQRATINTERVPAAGSSIMPTIFEHNEKRKDSSGLGKSSVKIVAPEQYDGRADIEIFEQWGLELNNYYQLTGIDTSLRIRHLPTFLKGKAAYFYRTHVARSPDEWNLGRFGRELFAYCFPDNYKELVRRRFDRLTQGRQPLSDFARNIETLAEQVTDVDDAQQRRRLFDEANAYLLIKWRNQGMNAERTSFDELEQTGKNFESAAVESVQEAMYN
ncbi:hypothetical protein M422DRAFT_251076 [Sphaerobolus stellatus SS14]|uniref:Retrotransposon gag domain-containing protein n=1 Tax=Sphaerobolus stellatus (strain SS14) TaxID=990650 RepID=A0A0C9VE45_SPHS4|nr:hypothetical protein M422DRAFT_251076 [Sphaerobolus stellatus SS14]